MKHGKLLRLNLLILMLAVSAGIIFCACGFMGRLPKGVIINGENVGGKSKEQATEIIRKGIESDLKEKTLIVYGKSNKYVFAYPEIGYKDNLQTLLKSVKRGGEYTTSVSYYLNGINEITAMICADECIPAVEPYAIFNTSGKPFTYCNGNDGVKVDRVKLLNDIRASLEGDFKDVRVSTSTVKRNTTLDEIKYNTRLLSEFTTNFDGGNECRAYNIYLAAKKINGTVLENGESFSFNHIVGERTAERGFKPAKIIERGEFVEGIGGGVCQVSTTLFNAALLAGCDITEFHAHSLAVSYVPPSFDAMVSGNYFDLKFDNKTGYPLYIRALTGKDYITFRIYGRGDGAIYDYHSEVKGNIPAPEEFTDDQSLVKEGRDGIISEGYLVVNRNGVSTVHVFRRDKYAPIKRVKLDILTDEKEDPPKKAG